MTEFFWGALAMASWTAGLFFLRFWRLTRDRLFLFFCMAFWVLALIALLEPGLRHWGAMVERW